MHQPPTVFVDFLQIKRVEIEHTTSPQKGAWCVQPHESQENSGRMEPPKARNSCWAFSSTLSSETCLLCIRTGEVINITFNKQPENRRVSVCGRQNSPNEGHNTSCIKLRKNTRIHSHARFHDVDSRSFLVVISAREALRACLVLPVLAGQGRRQALLLRHYFLNFWQNCPQPTMSFVP